MKEISIFNDITQEQFESMTRCFHPSVRKFKAGETICTYSDHIQQIAIILSGQAHLYCIDIDGNYSLLERCHTHDVLGEIFSLPLNNMEYIVEADTDSEIMFIDYQHIIKRCTNACMYHSQLVNNLFQLTALKTQRLTFHISLLSQRTTRQKILCYLKHIEKETGSSCFKIPMTLVKLAEYLCVDRSAMMREIRLMKKEGLLISSGRQFQLY